MNLLRLNEKFHPSEIEWRVQRSGINGDKAWALVLAYITNRAIMDRLDAVCGHGGWRNEYREGPEGGTLCGISIKIDDEWITKWDGAERTDIEAVKGGLSNAMKRAAVHWGIGRYLYKLESTFVDVTNKKTPNYINDKKTNVKGYWETPKLPEWALPRPMFNGLPKPRQDKARAQLFALASDLQVDPYEYCASQLEFDPNKGRSSLGASTVVQVSNAIKFLESESRIRRAGNNGSRSEKAPSQIEAQGTKKPKSGAEIWPNLSDAEFKKKLMSEVRKEDLKLHAVFADVDVSREGDALVFRTPEGYDWHTEKIRESEELLSRLTGMGVVLNPPRKMAVQ